MSLLRPQHGGNLSWAAAQAGCSPQDILDFSASINPLGPPPSVFAAIQQHLGEIQFYPDPSASLLRQQLSQLHQVPDHWILVGNGAAELLTWACRSLSGLNQTHVLTPAFRDYRRALKAFDAPIYPHPVPLALEDEPSPCADFLEHLLCSLEDVADAQSMGLLFNNPHNPTGQVFSKTSLLPLLDRVELAVIDEAFMEFLPVQDGYSLVPEVAAHPNLVILRSLTKFYSIPGLRLGYAIAHPALLAQWQSWRDPWSVNTMAIAAGVAALQDTAFQAQTHQWLASAAPQLRQGLQTISGLCPLSGAVNFVLVRCEVSGTGLQEYVLKQHRILIRDCISFPELGDRYFRVAVRTEAENERLLQALAEAIPWLR